jgi:hypothetical protein
VVAPVVGDEFTATCSGFGLQPGRLLFCEAVYETSFGTERVGGGGFVGPEGTWSVSFTRTCELNGGKVNSIEASGHAFPPPSRC